MRNHRRLLNVTRLVNVSPSPGFGVGLRMGAPFFEIRRVLRPPPADKDN